MSNFIEGKWYKSNKGTGQTETGFYYLKVLNSEDMTGEQIGSKGFILEGYWDAPETLRDALKRGPLTDLSEIQKFLPEGHPDKITETPKFEVGKWYKSRQNGETWYSKFKELRKDSEFWGEHVNPKKSWYDKHGWLAYGKEYNFQLVEDLSEIQQYLPEGHMDKIHKKLDENEFYYVDWTYCEDAQAYILKGSHIYLGLHNKNFGTDGNFNYPEYQKNLRKATEEEKQWLEACIKAGEFVPKESVNKKEEKMDNKFPLYVKDLYPGSVYVCSFAANPKGILFMYDHNFGTSESVPHIMLNTKKGHYKSICTAPKDMFRFRTATTEEIQLLNSYIIENKYSQQSNNNNLNLKQENGKNNKEPIRKVSRQNLSVEGGTRQAECILLKRGSRIVTI